MTTHRETSRPHGPQNIFTPARQERTDRAGHRRKRPPETFETDLPFGGQWRVVVYL